MTVNEMIRETLLLVGRDNVVADLESLSPSEESERIQRAFLTYLNAVTDELARCYFPIEVTQEMYSQYNKFQFSEFRMQPVRIRAVTDGKKGVGWRIVGSSLFAESTFIIVKYDGAPEKLHLNGEFYYPDPAVGARLVEYGMAAEHFLVCGDGAGFNSWEKKYRDEIDATLPHGKTHGRIPPRRWI